MIADKALPIKDLGRTLMSPALRGHTSVRWGYFFSAPFSAPPFSDPLRVSM